MSELKQAPSPTKGELLSLRLMILIGTISLGCFLYNLLKPANITHAPLYWMFVTATIFSCLRILHEWYHYLFISVPKPVEGNKPFTVDIFTTFCAGEPYDMVVETLTAMQAIRYPHTSWLCDEADDPYLREVCRRLGVRHVTRSDRKDAKAGNINNALRFATGDLCVVLDPDHVPVPEFLDPIVPFFNDEEVGYVQIVQAYYNIGDSLIAKGAAQQTFQFYGPMMMSMNRYGTVLAIGANCTFRRSALDSIGGHAAGLAEDMHTSMQLHAKGWKSVYLPAVLAQGRVPSTLSAYYKQQLKWARGTFELFVTTFPKRFKQFSWRQRFHYGTIPFHYLSGFIFLINFLVPVLSLVMGVIPFRMDLVEFTLLALPFLSATLAVRHFVQRWVMGRGERGNHVLGGFLLIGTWWVHILGFAYTLMRKEVPYIPTPKDDREEDNWKLNIPNILVAVCTLAAIIYGLQIEWNPYTWIMAGIAGLNLAVMLFNIVVSREKDIRYWRERFRLFRQSFVYYKLAKQQFWNFRHLLYAGLRIFAFPIILFVSFFTLYIFGNARHTGSVPLSENGRQRVFYTGLYSPAGQNGLTSMAEVRGLQEKFSAQFNIISLYIPWGDDGRGDLPPQLMRDIYRNGSLPLITWEPWVSGFSYSAADPDLQSDKNVFEHLVAGRFDAYLERFAGQVKALNKPVYIRFAHEPDNPAYPWSPSGGNSPEDFKDGWRYVHDFFASRRVYNVIWVWNPWKPAAAERYFPGMAYVDWIGMTGLNYGALNHDGKPYSFRELYEPFHRKYIYRSGLPVMVAEGGSIRPEGQQQWLENAVKDIAGEFREIKAFVLFNAGNDVNVPANSAGVSSIDWRLDDPGGFFHVMRKLNAAKTGPAKSLHYIRTPTGAPVAKALPYERPAAVVEGVKEIQNVRIPGAVPKAMQWMDTIRGVNYQKGANWFRNLYMLTRKEVTSDFAQMRRMGINTIRRYGPGVYDRNIFIAAEKTGMKIHYGFRLPSITDAIAGGKQLAGQAEKIVEHVRALKDHQEISAWYITNTAFPMLRLRFHKPDYLYQQKAYTAWLKQLVADIRKEDPERPVTIDIEADTDIVELSQYLRDEIPQAAALGLAPVDANSLVKIAAVPAPHFISAVSAEDYGKIRKDAGGVFITAWQDQGSAGGLSFDGLLDHEGRYKPGFYLLQQLWKQAVAPEILPGVNILRPAETAKESSRLVYRAVVRHGENWRLAAEAGSSLRYEWHLVRKDRRGETVMMKRLGEGPDIALDVPFNPSAYRLYLTAARGRSVVTATVTLNTPL
ncbi:glycosyltransferase family 2 protein [Chitinophaga sp. YIM B06452]|uniref:glycosyltransferase family 2 protein n=1 Tax=Chitinophaga sp. YIM B06452 TaxID=3082158 RepID=UPI0031FE89B6